MNTTAYFVVKRTLSKNGGVELEYGVYSESSPTYDYKMGETVTQTCIFSKKGINYGDACEQIYKTLKDHSTSLSGVNYENSQRKW